jgi:hypothetical protein
VPRVAAEHFHNDDTVVGLAGGFEVFEKGGDAVDGGVEPDGIAVVSPIC